MTSQPEKNTTNIDSNVIRDNFFIIKVFIARYRKSRPQFGADIPAGINLPFSYLVQGRPSKLFDIKRRTVKMP